MRGDCCCCHTPCSVGRVPTTAAWVLTAVALLTACTSRAAGATPPEGLGGVTTVKALQDFMYRDMRGWGGAYKLLNATGRVGSQGAPDALQFVDAPLWQYDPPSSSSLDRGVVVLVPVRQSAAFFTQLASDAAFAQHVQGILVDDTEPPSHYSTLAAFPGAQYAPYAQQAYPWNAAAVAAGTAATPLALSWLPAPAFLLSLEMAAQAAERALHNTRRDPRQPRYHARLKLPMSADSAANSSACLAAGSCKPLGGYSVWAAVPLLPPPPAPGAAGGDDGRPIILVAAQTDSIDMFHDAVQGAGAPLSGLVAMLAALAQLSAAPAAGYSKRLVFAALAGEPWGYMGSRRLLWEAASGSNATAGLDISRVQQVVEVGQVSNLPRSGGGDGRVTLFAHRQRDAAHGDASAVVAALSAAAQQDAPDAKVRVQEADARTPGIPPSSLMSFLRVQPSIQGVVLAEFDTAFSNPYYASRFDNGSRVDLDSVAAAAAVLAGALHRLAGGDPSALRVNVTAARELVRELVSCLILPAPGFGCSLAASLMSADYVVSKEDGSHSYAPQSYVGVLQYVPDVQGPAGKPNLARFLWNFMGQQAAAAGAGAACDPFDTPCSGAGQVCVGWHARGKSAADRAGVCMNATVRYVLSFSTAIACDACDDPWGAVWRVSDAADAWHAQHAWPRDPAWAESDWPPAMPDLQLYLHEAPAVERAVLAAGLVLTAAAAAASYAARTAFHRHHVAAACSESGRDMTG